MCNSGISMKHNTSTNGICQKCQQPFIKKTYNQKFCNFNCGNSFRAKRWSENNKNVCKQCGDSIHFQSEYCVECYRKDKSDNAESRNFTLRQVHKHASNLGRHPSWVNSEVRTYARSWNKHLKGLPCQKCAYNKHTEFCHITAITAFNLSTKLSIINAPENLFILCPNCHWEFDNGLLNQADIPKRS